MGTKDEHDTAEGERDDAAAELAEAVRTLLRQLTVRAQDTRGDGRLDLAGSELQLLSFLFERPGAMSKEAGRFLGLTATTIQSVIDRLVRRGLVAKGTHERDGRAVALSLTDEGEHVVATIRARDVANCVAMLDALPPRRRDAFVRDFKEIATRIEERD